MKRSPIKRRTPTPRSTTPLRQRRRAKPGERADEQTARIVLYARACQPFGHPLCEIGLAGVCTWKAADPHHRRKQSQGGPWVVANLVAVCRPCHMVISDTRDEFYNRGWLVRSFQDWAKVPLLRRGAWVWLLDSGEFVPLGLTEIAEWVGAA